MRGYYFLKLETEELHITNKKKFDVINLKQKIYNHKAKKSAKAMG